MPIAMVPQSRSLFWLKEKNNLINWWSRSNLTESYTHLGEDPPLEEGDVMERESYWTDNDGSFSEEYNSTAHLVKDSINNGKTTLQIAHCEW